MASAVLSKTFAAAATLAVGLSLAAAPAGAATGSTAGAEEARAVDLARHTAIAAIAATNSGGAVKALADSLALLGTRYKLEEEGAAEPIPAPPEHPAEKAVDTQLPLPPASAGSNGTTIPHKASLRAEPLFAHSRGAGSSESTAILLSGVALAPPDAPEAVTGAINNANTIVGRPYIWGGGHGDFYSYGYDCSGAVSFALFGGGLIPEPLTSTSLEGWGAPGPGKWITVYANASHAFAEIAGLRWDTVGDENGTGPRWHLATASPAGFVVRHPPGL